MLCLQEVEKTDVDSMLAWDSCSVSLNLDEVNKWCLNLDGFSQMSQIICCTDCAFLLCSTSDRNRSNRFKEVSKWLLLGLWRILGREAEPCVETCWNVWAAGLGSAMLRLLATSQDLGPEYKSHYFKHPEKGRPPDGASPVLTCSNTPWYTLMPKNLN